MNDALYIAATGLQAQQLNVDTIANNLANVNTSGFKAGRVSFRDLVSQGLPAATVTPGGLVPLSSSLSAGVTASGVLRSMTSGELKQTSNPMDLAIQGEGWLEVQLADGSSAFTRGGTLQVNADGLLATADGNPLKPGIAVSGHGAQIVIGADGTVSERSSSGNDSVNIGRIELARFADASSLEPVGNGIYRATEKSGDASFGRGGLDGFGSLAQGFAESSNVRLVDEMVNLMVAQRAYEMSTKVIQAADEMLAMSNNLRR